MGTKTVSIANVKAKKFTHRYSSKGGGLSVQYKLIFDDQTFETVSQSTFDRIRIGDRVELHRMLEKKILLDVRPFQPHETAVNTTVRLNSLGQAVQNVPMEPDERKSVFKDLLDAILFRFLFPFLLGSLFFFLPILGLYKILTGDNEWTYDSIFTPIIFLVTALMGIVLLIYLNRITFRLLRDWSTAKKSVVEETVYDVVESDLRYSRLSPAPSLIMNGFQLKLFKFPQNLYYLETGGQWREVEKGMLSTVVVGDTLTLHLAPYSGLVLGVEPQKPVLNPIVGPESTRP